MPSPAFERYASDGALVLGGGAAILLQLADPVVAAGVRAHSAFARDPLARLTGTMRYVYAVGIGSPVQQNREGRSVDAAHHRVPGARDAEHQLWVAATLYAVGVDLHERLFGPMPAGLAEEVFAESARLGTTLQLPEAAWPRDSATFAAYWDAQVATLEVGDDARAVCRDLLHPRVGPWWLKAAMPLARLVTAALLPERIREAYAIPRRPRREAAALALARRIARATPHRIRAIPARRLLAADRDRR